MKKNLSTFLTIRAFLSSTCSNQPKAPSLAALLKSGFTPTLQDFNQFLYFLSKTQKRKSIIRLFTQLTSNQIKTDAQTHSILIEALIRDQKYEEAIAFIQSHLKRTHLYYKNSIFDALIQEICVKERDPEKALSVLQYCLKIDDAGILPSSLTFCKLICSFSSNGKMDKAIEVLELMADDKIKYPFDNFVCSSVLSGFVRIGKPELAIGFYENAVKTGALKPNIVTYTVLVTAYSMVGRIKDVSGLVSWMEMDGLSFDAVFYSNWICGCFRGGMIKEALRIHRGALDSKVEVDAISYTILIDGLTKEGDVEKAVGFLYKMGKNGVSPSLVTYTAIMLGFCKKGKLEEAFAVFKMVDTIGIEMDEYPYSILIDGVCRKGDFDLAFSLLGEMEMKGIRPSVITYNTIINGLCKAGRTCEAENISKSIDEDVVTYSTLLHGYVEEADSSGVIEVKRRLEAAGVHMDVIMCNIIIRALLMIGSFEEAHDVYNHMPDIDLTPNLITYCTLIDGFSKAGRIDEALEIFGESRNISSDSSACYNCIIKGLCREGMVGMAVEVFLELIHRNLTVDRATYKTLIKTIFSGEGAEGLLGLIHKLKIYGHEIAGSICDEAICFLSEKGFSEVACNGLTVMRIKGLTAASKSYYSTLRALLCEGKKWLTPHILCAFVRTHGMSDVRVNKILVHYLCINKVVNAVRFLSSMRVSFPAHVLVTLTKDGRVLDAYELMLKADTLLVDVFHISIVIDGLCKGGYISKALDLFAFAKKRGITLSIVAYNSVINALCQQGCLVEALRLFDALEQISIPPSEVTYGTLVNSLSKEGHLLDARRLVDKMLMKDLKPSAWVFNALINGYCKLGQIEEALNLLCDLDTIFLQPNEFTVSAIINGYIQKGDMEGAVSFFLKFKRKGISPDFLGFLSLARGLYAKGRMEESRDILREMLQSPSVIHLLTKVDREVELDSAQGFLLSLCERGGIQETISILDELGSIFFLRRKTHGTDEGLQKLTGSVSRKFRSLENMENKHADFDTSSDRSLDFHTFYTVVSSLHLEGKHCKANKLAKMVFGFQGSTLDY